MSSTLPPKKPLRDIVIQMVQADTNAIKQMLNLAVSRNTSYLNMKDLAALDMNDNPVVAIPSSSALQASEFASFR